MTEVDLLDWCRLRRDVEHVVYRCRDAQGVLLYIGATNSLTQRKWHHKMGSPWWLQVATVATEPYPNRETALRAERAAIQRENPVHNRERYLKPPPAPCPT